MRPRPRRRWLVLVSYVSIMSFAAPVLFPGPTQEWHYFRWRWLAKLWAALLAFPQSTHVLVSARLVGRVTERTA